MTTRLKRNSAATKNMGWQILVVDDEPECASLFSRILRNDGYTVRAATSGKEALQMLREQPADLVLADMVMPGMNGMELLANIKELYPETDVIILTGYGTIEDSLEALRRGAADFLPKPFQPRELGRLTASCLRARRINSDESFIKQSQAMVEIARLLTQTTDMHTLPQRAVEMACQNFDADSALLLAYDAARERFSVLAQAGGAVARWNDAQQLTRQAQEAVRQLGSVLSAEPGNGDCYAYVPLVVGGAARGLLCLRRKDGPWFHEKSSDLLDIFATHLALALESARLYQTAAAQVNDLEELMERGRSLSLMLRPDDIREQLLLETARMTGAEICAVLTCVEGRSHLRILPDTGEDSELAEAVRQRLDAVMRPQNEESAHSPGRPSAIGAWKSLASFLHAPLRCGERRLGVLAVFSSTPDGFSVEEARRLTTLADNAALALNNAAMMEQISSMYHESIEMLSSSVDALSAFSLGHSRQVSVFAGELARALGLPAADVYRIEDGALLHDVGKICIPESVLKKPSPLTAEEYAIVKAHPIYGANMFDRAPHLIDLAPIVRHHHESYDGTGYPDGLKGEEIPLAARIVALGDVFDALVSHRSYRPAIKLPQARRMIELKAGSQFDPDLARAFLALPLEDLIEH